MFKSFLTVLLIFLIQSTIQLHAQTDSLKTERIHGKEFYIYNVADGESLYRISKKFDIPQEEIILYNQQAINGVKAGMELRVPVVSQRKSYFMRKEEAKAKVETPIVSDPNFTIHKVEQGQTIYSICRLYQIEQQTLIENNPSVNEGLKIGDELKIPSKNAIAPSTAKPVEPVVQKIKIESSLTSATYILHTVEPKETLYSLSRKNKVTIDEIKSLNPELLTAGLKIGQVIKIPLKNAPTNIVPKAVSPISTPTLTPTTVPAAIFTPKDTSKLDTTLTPEAISNFGAGLKIESTPIKKKSIDSLKTTKKVVKLSLLLPFMLNDIQKQDATLDKFVEFYEGCLLGIKTLKDQGISVELSTYDIEKSEEKVKQVLKNNPAILKSDLIIGPAYSAQVNELSKYSKANNIPLVVPFSSKVDSIANCPLVFQNNCPQYFQLKKATSLFVKNFADKNIIILNINNDINDEGSEFVRVLKPELRKNNIGFQDIQFTQENIMYLGNSFIEGKENIIVLATDKFILLKDVLPKLKALNTGTMQVSVFGFANWKNDLKEMPSTYYYSPFFIDRKNPSNGIYRTTFREEFGYPPVSKPRFDLMGYDLSSYFIKAINIYGNDFSSKLAEYPQTDALQSRFNFVQFNNGGYMNLGLSIIHYKDREGYSIVE